jgi:DNA-binding CsgD family transcriptional regulator
MAFIDEALVAVTGGELSPVITGLIYCIAITHCQQVYALDRAREWAASLAGWCDAQPQLTSFTGACQVHRAEIKQLAGAWPEAIEEARRVAEHPPRSAEPDPSGDAFYQQGEVHRLRGELAEAEAAYRRASQAGRDPQPGLALLRLSQERRDEAASGIRRALGATSDPLQRARLLPTSVEVELAVGKVEEARAACGELEGIAARFDTEVLATMAAHARGEVLLAEGDAGAALGPLRRAFAGWQRAAIPYVTGRVRVLLGLACRALGDRDGSTLELEAARAIFERLGAAPELARMDSAGRGEKARSVGLTPRELEVLRLVAAGKTNKDIAKQLFLSGKTIDRHVSNIFLKASVSSRAAATAFAYKNKLV